MNLESPVLSEIVEKYEHDGYLLLQNVIDQGLVQEAKNHVEWLMKQHPNERPENLHHGLMKDDPFMLRLAGDDRLLDVAQEFVGPNIALFAAHYLSKPPRDGKPVLWHQDGSYWPLDPMEVVSLWLAVDDSLPENGCMQVIPGSHKTDLSELRKSDGKDVLGGQMDPALVDESKAVNCVLKAGGISVHHPHTIHGSKANHSEMRRCGMILRYISTNAKIVADKDGNFKNWPAFLLRGNAIPGINDYLPFPKYVEGKHMAFRGCEDWK